MPNRLIQSTSPYLLQHAHNPVDWYEWGGEALQKAKQEDKPILVSIGYSACHWCHVMERESFENTDIAQIMNEHFVCIKVDREERPDVDQLYMEAVQAMQQNGGWPLNVFLTPDQEPFFGGTYFPARNWAQLLLQINRAFIEKRGEINESAKDLANHLQANDINRFAQQHTSVFTRESLHKMFSVFVSKFDKNHGGLDRAPKFVMPSIWMFLLRYWHLQKNQEALDMVTVTLRKMCKAGLYDQVNGGFARYSVDAEWFAPHFEKMLYDNAQLLTLYAEAYQITKDNFFKTILKNTISWLEHEMMHPEGGFYSALDADSDGVEGKYYTWTMPEWQHDLGPDAEAAAAYFGITTEGNWEHGRNILMVSESSSASDNEIKRWRLLLAAAQQKRIRPGLDDKILAGWNALTIRGLVDAYLATADENALQLALRALNFIEKNMMVNGRLYRSYKNKLGTTEGFLEDYACLIQAYLSVYQATFQEEWLRKAEAAIHYTLKYFFDTQDGYFFYASTQAEKLIASKKEIFDNVIPSSNSMMAQCLFRCGTLLDRDDWKEKAFQMTHSLTQIVESAPESLSNWGIAMMELIQSLHEVAVIGKHYKTLRKEFGAHYLPFAVFLGTSQHSTLPLLADKEPKAETVIYVCRDKTCGLPVTTLAAALPQLSN